MAPRAMYVNDSLTSTCVEINQCVGCTRQVFTKSFLGDDAAVLARRAVRNRHHHAIEQAPQTLISAQLVAFAPFHHEPELDADVPQLVRHEVDGAARDVGETLAHVDVHF